MGRTHKVVTGATQIASRYGPNSTRGKQWYSSTPLSSQYLAWGTFLRPGHEALVMTGDAKVHYDGIVAFPQTDSREDLKKITMPVLVMHSKDDQLVPYVVAGPLSAKLLRNGILKTYAGVSHGMITTQAETVNADVLEFIRS